MVYNTLTIICLAVILLLTLIGLKRGFVMSVYHLCSFLIILILAMILGRFAANWAVGNSSIYGAVYDKVAAAAEALIPTEETAEALTDSAMPDGAEKYLPDETRQQITDTVSGAIADVKDAVYDEIAVLIIRMLAYIVTFIIVGLIVKLIFRLLDLVSRLPGLNAANRIGGLLMGLAEGIVLVWLFCGIKPMTDVIPDNPISSQIEENACLSYMADNNLVTTLVSNKVSNVSEDLTGISDVDELKDMVMNGSIAENLDSIGGRVGEIIDNIDLSGIEIFGYSLENLSVKDIEALDSLSDEDLETLQELAEQELTEEDLQALKELSPEEIEALKEKYLNQTDEAQADEVQDEAVQDEEVK